MNSIVSLNNEGTAFLRAKNFDAAIHTFTLAIHRLRYVQEEEEGNEGIPSHSENEAPSVLPSHEISTFDVHEFVSEAGDTIFNRAFSLVDRNRLTHWPTTQMDGHYCVTTLLLNLALSYHLRSIAVRSESRFRDRKRAKRLYEAGVKAFFFMVGSSPQSYIHSSIHRLLAVLVNNLGCIAVEEYDYYMVERCIEWAQVENIPNNTPSLFLNHLAWYTFMSNPAPAA